ncbi:hypothetical protein DFH07DRAFT_768856 [Mycena maculata]|uniref:Myb/SANT-like domain-containing protein n=1 Tax=Mycena maculata TaxID=230809 RepID=A0AAD7JSI8_9AGAR|nr:hypothetical protein DFH07DRAFT_768856 [Mycena maculata]
MHKPCGPINLRVTPGRGLGKEWDSELGLMVPIKAQNAPQECGQLDLTHALKFLHDQRSCVSNGGNFDKTVFNEAAKHMADNWPPQAGGPKTADSIMAKWKEARKLHDYILQAKQKRYPGASGWTYTNELGFNVTDDDRDAWKNFSKAHSHFKPFATCRWIHFETVDEIIPLLARGRYVFNAGASQPIDSAPAPLEQSQDNAEEQHSDDSQPFSDWSQSNHGESQPPNINILQPSQSTVAHGVSATPASALKCAPSDNVGVPWSNKRTRVTGPESILALGHSVDGIGKVMATVFAPQKSSAMSPTKKVEAARKLALEDMDGGYIAALDRTCLNILFGCDTSAADAYISDADPFLHAAMAQELLNPTLNYK